MSDRKTYRATAERDGRFWYLSIDELDAATQARRLDQAEEMVRDLISIKLGVPPDSFDVAIEPKIEGRLGDQVRRAKRAKTEASARQAIASLSLRIAAEDLEKADLTVRDIGVILGVSHQRVAQLLAEEAPAGGLMEMLAQALTSEGMTLKWYDANKVAEEAMLKP